MKRNALFLTVALLSVHLSQAETGLKVHISADLEGVVGTVTREQTGQGGWAHTVRGRDR